MKRFEHFAPQCLEDAVTLMRGRPEAVPLAGGTDLLVQLKEGSRSAQTVIGLTRIPELRHLVSNGSLTIGSTNRLARIATDLDIRQNWPALAVAAGLIGSPQIRNAATIGGNLCNAAPSADTAPVLLCLDATVTLASADGERTLPLEEFFLGPGQTALRAGELLKEVVVPAARGRCGSSYVRHTPRTRMDLAVASAAANVTVDEDNVIVTSRLALGAVAVVPMRAHIAESMLVGKSMTEGLLRDVGAAAAEEVAPISDVRASAGFRRHLAHVLTQRAIEKAFAEASGSQQ